MKLLLDTHVAIWCVVNDRRLGRAARTQLEQAEGRVWVSAATIWEISIKYPLRNRAEPMPFTGIEAIQRFEDAGFALLPIRPEHAAAVEQLPLLHSDPFDRLLLAQARYEPMHLLTSDDMLAAYGHNVLKV